MIKLPVIIIGLTFRFMFYLSLSDLLDRIRETNRELNKGYIWANMLPLVWMVIFPYTASKLAASLSFELHDLKIQSKSKNPSLITGIVYYLFTLLGELLMLIGAQANEDYSILFGLFFFTIGFAFFIIYWTQIVRYKKRLIKLQIP